MVLAGTPREWGGGGWREKGGGGGAAGGWGGEEVGGGGSRVQEHCPVRPDRHRGRIWRLPPLPFLAGGAATSAGAGPTDGEAAAAPAVANPGDTHFSPRTTDLKTILIQHMKKHLYKNMIIYLDSLK